MRSHLRRARRHGAERAELSQFIFERLALGVSLTSAVKMTSPV